MLYLSSLSVTRNVHIYIDYTSRTEYLILSAFIYTRIIFFFSQMFFVVYICAVYIGFLCRYVLQNVCVGNI